MNRFRNLLVYVPPGGGGSPALDAAFELARQSQVPVKLLGVVEDDGGLLGSLLRGGPAGPLLEEQQRAELEAVAHGPAAFGVQVTCKVRRGRPFVEIIHEVLAARHDLVIKGALGHAGGILGPTALHLMRKCPCPVWVVKPGRHPVRRVVAAVDADLENEERRDLQRTVLELARSLAAGNGADLSVVHAWRLPGRRVLGPGLSDVELATARVAARETARIQAETLLSAVHPQIPRQQLVLVEGDHGSAVADHLSASGADLVVMGTVSRSGVPGLLIGNTAERVLRTLDCSVLAVKPAGFTSPIRAPVDATIASELQDREYVCSS